MADCRSVVIVECFEPLTSWRHTRYGGPLLTGAAAKWQRNTMKFQIFMYLSGGPVTKLVTTWQAQIQ